MFSILYVTLCLLCVSQCCTRASSSHIEHGIGEIILKALWVSFFSMYLLSVFFYSMGSNLFSNFQFDNSGDSANIEPCMTILRNLSSSLYGDMKIETQVVPLPHYALGSCGDFCFLSRCLFLLALSDSQVEAEADF